MFTMADEETARKFWMEDLLEEGRKEGRAEGEEKGILTSIKALMKNLKLSPEQAIMAEQVISVSEDLTFNFNLIMLLDAQYEPDEDKRVDKAFRHPGKDPADEERFDEYVRGGVDILFEKLIEGGGEPIDYICRLYDFIDDIEDRYNKVVDLDALMKLCAS